MKRTACLLSLFVVGVGCFAVAFFALVTGVAGVVQRVHRGLPGEAVKVAGSAVLMVVVGFILGTLALQGLKRLRAGELAARGFDVLPPG